METFQIVITLVLFLLIVIPLGKYLYSVLEINKSFVDPVFDKIDNFIYKITGITRDEMTWKQYVLSHYCVNAIMVYCCISNI